MSARRQTRPQAFEVRVDRHHPERLSIMPDDDVPLLRPSAAGELGLHLNRLRPLRRLRPARHRPRPGASPLPPGRRLRPPTLAATPPRRL